MVDNLGMFYLSIIVFIFKSKTKGLLMNFSKIALRYPDRDITITVSEDGENGATIRYLKSKPYQQLAI
jgi:hypothetical protein